MNYQLRAGAAAATPPSLKNLGIFSENQELLLVAIHPHCPCTKATVTQLEKTLATLPSSPKLKTIVYTPAPQTSEWLNSDVVQHLSRIGFEIVPDPYGKIARKLGAETSGHVFYYDEKGRVKFSGGITPVRGHAGANAAEQSLHLLLTGGKREHALIATVYGCSIIESQPGGDQ